MTRAPRSKLIPAILISALGFVAALAAPAAVAPAGAQVFPPGFNDSLIVSGLNVPTTFLFTPDGRILVGEQGGAIRVVDAGQILSTPMLTLNVEDFDEQGLLGMALAPGYPDPPYLYVCYTPFTGSTTNNWNRVSRFTIDGNTISPASEVVVFDDIPTGSGFHVGGCLRFAPDGNLLVSTGDTGWSTPYPQDLTRLEGKLLRITPTGGVPSDNPFVSTPGARGEIYQWGLRNPFRFAVQPATGQPFIGDVGFNTWEEVNRGPAGANFGWPIHEGITIPPDPQFTDPIFAYNHSAGSAAIVGNVFYQGANFPASYQGNYFFFDHARGHLGRMVLDEGNNVVSVTHPWAQTASSGWGFGPVDLVLGNDGALYYCTYLPGRIRRIFYTGSANRSPTAIASASPTAGYPPLSVAFNGEASYDVDGDSLTYSWDFGDNRPLSSLMNPAHFYITNGVYEARLTVSDGRGGVNTSEPIEITVGNLPPAITIATPADSSMVQIDNAVFFSGSAVDPEEGVVPAGELHWSVFLHHLNHIHPTILDQVGSSGSFPAGSHGEDPSTIYYRITLWAEDATGLRGERVVFVFPDPEQSGTDVPGAAGTPAVILSQNTPNPFTPSTEIRFRLAKPARAALGVFDVEGRLVRRLMEAPLGPGEYGATWDGRTDRGDPAASGVYVYRLETAAGSAARRMVLLR